MIVVGLTGGIASGKSTVARRLEELGACWIDADDLARRAVQVGSPVLDQIRKALGSGVIGPDGSLDRAAMGQLVFSRPEALTQLNEIIHPAIRSLLEIELVRAQRRGYGVAVVEAALMAEAEDLPRFHTVVVTRAPMAERLRRLMAERGYDREQATNRLRAQASDDARARIADAFIDTDGSLSDTFRKVDALWRRLASPRNDD